MATVNLLMSTSCSTDVIQRDTWFPLKMVQASPLINVPFISIVSLIPRGPSHNMQTIAFI